MIILCTVLPKRDHEFYCGAEMIFECAEGFKMVDSSSLQCLETGNWSNHMPVCEYSPESTFTLKIQTPA